MSVRTNGSSYITIATPPGSSFDVQVYAKHTVHVTNFQALLRVGSTAAGNDGADFFSGPEIAASRLYANGFDDSGDDLVELAWLEAVWACYRITWDDTANTLRMLVHADGERGWQTLVTRSGTYDEAITQMRIFAGRTGTATVEAGGMFDNIKVWSAVQDDARAYEESLTKELLNESFIYSVVPCINNGSAVGAATRGISWTATGSGLYHVDEGPNYPNRRGLMSVGL